MLSYFNKIIKKLIFSFALLYAVGIILNFLGIMVPINIYTIITVSLLGFPGIISLVMVYIFLLREWFYEK